MDQTEILRGHQRFLDLQRELAEVLPGERGLGDDVIERLPGEQFHHDEWSVLVGADVVDGDDVRVLERGQGAGFLLHLAGGFLALRALKSGGDALHRDLALQCVVPGTKNGTKSTLAEFPTNFVSFLHAVSFAQSEAGGRAAAMKKNRNGGLPTSVQFAQKRRMPARNSESRRLASSITSVPPRRQPW